ncbi:beta-ketoacyl-[acyl-carrier-protein] synthase family protein [Ruminiclostridium cellulolyticum]|uniref:Beta-ketoacyl synthase n=1 Tax=Ruminiclostridium cellulolyticum (strain ATCC 35319 / DSM 5812 / JCM 6584 / H10) TaxID=394503 RepID=B8I8K5_RUMCH|nr:beta-ketoacyl-[acyl-carrier-protein] synthase family protein [Ruminiclostridium cellulolyticum]ACL75238.1 Beta-ketoacyl synthase [Ruminiclostridium cellulolyticum H10]
MSRKRVVISGIGIISPIGDSIDDFWNAVLDGKSGIKYFSDEYRHLNINGVKGGGYISRIDLSRFEIRKDKIRQIKDSEKTTKMLIYAGLSALEDAGIKYPLDVEKYNLGMIVGTGMSLAERYSEIPYSERNPKWFLETYPNIHLAYFSTITSLKGFSSTIVTACTGGSQAIGTAFRMICNGDADIMLAGGVDSRFSTPYIYGFSRLNMINTEQDLLSAMRPFDRNRSGFVMGEGSCILVIESLEHCMERGGTAICEIVGYGNASDATSLTDANCHGKYRAMDMALRDAGISIDQIDYINSHGTSTQSNDREESKAIKELFGKRAYDIPVNSTKSIIGHTFAACGAIEAAVCAKSILSEKIHKTLNFTLGDIYCDLNYVKDDVIQKKIAYCISNNSSIGGYNTSLVFKEID